MNLQNSGSFSRTPEGSSGGGQQEPRASASTSRSQGNRESHQTCLEAVQDFVEGSQRNGVSLNSSDTAQAALPSLPPARKPDSSLIPTQGAAVTALTQTVAALNLCGPGEPLVRPPARRCLEDPKQSHVPQTQQQEEQEHQHQPKQKQKAHQQDMLLPLAMPLGEGNIEDLWPLNLARQPSAEMMQHVIKAPERHQDPIDAFAQGRLNPATPTEAVTAPQGMRAEQGRARQEMGTCISAADSHKINGNNTKKRVTSNGCDGADDGNSYCSNRSINSNSWLGRPQQLPLTSNVPCSLTGVFQPRGDCPVGPCDVVATGVSAAAASSTTAEAGAFSRGEVCETVDFTSAKKADALHGLLNARCKCRRGERNGSTENDGGSNDSSADNDNMQRVCCGVRSSEDTSSEFLKNARGPPRQLRNAATADILDSSNGSHSSHSGIHPQEQQGVPDEKHLQQLLQQQPHKQPEVLQTEKKGQSQQLLQAQKQQQQQKPREFVRRLALGLLMGHRASRKERRERRNRVNETHQDQQQQDEEQEQRQRQQQKQQEDDADWEACCLLQPADERTDGLAAESRSNNNNGTGLGGYRRAPSKLQRMAFSFGCFGEASQRRTDVQRENCRSLTPAQYKAWRRRHETYADDGSLFPRGLANLKNTCFLNAALQALAGIPSFVASLQDDLPSEPGVGEAQWQGTPNACDVAHDGNKDAASATAAAACSSTTASPDSEEARGQQTQQLPKVQLRSEQQTEERKELLQQQLVQRQELLQRLRLQQERREKHQPECLGSLDKNQRRLLLREFFTLLCRLTCCPSIRPYGNAEETPPVDLAAQRPRESNSAATCRLEHQQQQQQRQVQQMPAVDTDTIRPERLRRALVAPLAGLLLNDCNMQQQQDCHEFLRGLIDLIHEIFKTSRWEREEAAAAEQLLQLQAILPVSDEEPSALTSLGPLRIPGTADDDRQEQRHMKPIQAQLAGAPIEGNESSEPDKAVGGDGGDVERAEKTWREYIRDQASPMADFFAGQLCSEIQCAGCRHSLFIYEPAWDLSLPLPLHGNKVSLDNLLEGFFGSEELEFSCSKCHSPACKAHRTIRYTHPPKVLLLQIKRFSASGQKRRTRVEFPVEELVIETKRESATFRLIAVIEHNGSSCQSGHYVAYVRRRRFVAPVVLPPSTAGATSGRPETPRNAACSPSEFLKRIGIFKGFTSFASHSLRHPNGPSTAPPSGTSPREPPQESPFRPPRPAMSFEGMADDGTEWFRFDDGLVLPVSEAEVFSAEAYCLFYSRTDNTERQCSSSSKQESSAIAGATGSSKLGFIKTTSGCLP
ncbi:elongator complex protein 3, putative [Eimeria brunetti]|uniref:ubiquitinyl hydrolase 1 n=1 Tax=Eimeria brunetti TaxID=51314 RepID=U6LVE4_9EIME|nr:elongator complex protein 3, putative [Eimeria brunetti]